MSDVQSLIAEILADDSLDDESSDISKPEKVESLIGQYGWEPICKFFFNILRDDSQEKHWPTAAAVFWDAACDKREIPADELIALLYFRFDPTGTEEDNLVWSVTSRLKGVGYLSKYEPLKDPGVAKHFCNLRGEPKKQ